MVAENVNSQGNDGELRNGLQTNINSGRAENSSLSLEDLTSLIRGSADILEGNSPRFVALVNQANQLG